jgi:hypothetical protein
MLPTFSHFGPFRVASGRQASSTTVVYHVKAEYKESGKRVCRRRLSGRYAPPATPPFGVGGTAPILTTLVLGKDQGVDIFSEH